LTTEFANDGGSPLKLGTKLTLYLSLIIILVLSGYGYLDILSRRDILVRKMKSEVRSTGRTLEVSLEKISPREEKEYVQVLIDAVTESERTLGVIVYDQREKLTFRSRSLEEGTEPYLDLVRRSIREDRPQEEFGVYKKVPIFSYTFPFKDRTGKDIGGVSILQNISFMEKEIERAKQSIFITIFVLIGGTVALVLLGTRRWVTKPISKLMEGIKNLAKGNLDHQIDLKKGDELSELAQAFNQMAVDLKKAQDRIIREAETKLELERHLRQSEKLAIMGQLASGLAHEIGTPLNIISGRAELIERRLEDKEGIKKNSDIIIDQTERITKILRQLLGFIRKKKPEQAALNINTLLEATLDLLDHQIQKHRVRVVKDWAEDLPPVIGDPDQLQQAFLNLMLNAIQAMPEGGTLHLSASSKKISKRGLEEAQRQYMEVCVGDTGVGIEREALQNIFNPFFTTKDTGTGLGLMVTQGIIQDHEGWIDVESEVRKGSVFKIYLPCFQGGDR
jgi:two-component system NtrC family sensor kinase